MTIRICVLTVSDSVYSGTRDNLSATAITDWISKNGNTLAASEVVPDEEAQIVLQLEAWIEAAAADVILTTGGTGFSSRDITPEATWAVIEREAPGIAEALRAAARPTVPTASLSRGIAGIVQHILIVNLPGSVNGVKDGLAVLDTFLDHAVKILHDETEH